MNTKEETSQIASLADLDHWLETCTSMASNRRYERRSAIRRTSKWCGKPASEVSAEPSELRKVFARLSPGELQVTRKSLSNTKSAVLAAIRAAGILPKTKYVDTFSAEWREIWTRLTVPEKRQLSRMFRYASTKEVKPEQVDDLFSTAFLNHLTRETLTKYPKRAHQNACRRWNGLCVRLPNFPGSPIAVPRYMARLCLPMKEFPETLWAEFDAFCSMLQKTDYFDKRAPNKPLRPKSIESYRRRFHMYISALVLAGEAPAAIRRLAYCIQSKQVQKGLQALLDWRRTPGYEARHSAAACAILLLTIANRAVAKPKKADVEFLKMTAAKLRVRHKGMSSRNRKKIVPLKSEANLSRLFIMPLAIAKRLAALPDYEITDTDALLFEKVLSLIVLMFCPLRISTLVSLHLDRNLVWGGKDMTGPLMLDLQEHQLKGDHAEVMPVPKLCADLVRIYVHRFRDRRARSGCRFLFVGEGIECGKSEITLSRQIKDLVFEKLGFDVTPHVYRHLVHIVVLNRFPGAYAMVSRVLTHKNINTTIQNYAYMDVELSMKAYQDLVLDEVVPGKDRPRPSITDIAYGLNQEKLSRGHR